MNQYDVVILGGGPGGYTTAIRCKQYGLSVAIVEKDKLGGTCLNRGCIPTKAMLSSAELFAKIKKSDSYGITVSDFSVNMQQVIDRKNEIVSLQVGGLDKLFKIRKIAVFNQFGSIVTGNIDEHSVKLEDGTILEGKNIVLATGSEPLDIPFFNIDRKNVITSNEALNLTSVPKNILVIGGGVVGCEFASMLHDFGSEVTIVEMLKFLVPTEDNQISRTLQTAFKKRSILLKLKTKVEKIEIIADGEVEVSFSDGTVEVYDKVLAAGGRSINIVGNGLDNMGLVLTENGGFIDIDDKMKTNLPNIYAIGDITGKMMLAHVAASQGLVVAADIAGKEFSLDYDSVPAAVFTTPEIASVGKREQELKEKKIEYKSSRFYFAANGKANSMGEPDGFVKILTDEVGVKILGAHIIGPHASDLLQEIVNVKENDLSIDTIINSVHSHPTLSEAVLEAVESIHKMAIHSL